jgi:hypothetical protein
MSALEMQARGLTCGARLHTQLCRGNLMPIWGAHACTCTQQRRGRGMRAQAPSRSLVRRGQLQIMALRNVSGHDVPVSSPIINEKGIVVSAYLFTTELFHCKVAHSCLCRPLTASCSLLPRW